MNKCVLSASGSGHPVVCWLLTAAEMKRCDSNTSEIFGVPSVVLMERAALSCVDVIVSRQKKLEEQAGQLGLHPKRRVLLQRAEAITGRMVSQLADFFCRRDMMFPFIWHPVKKKRVNF